MTISHWFVLLFILGIGFALWHTADTLRRYFAWKRSGENGLHAHVAIGDLRGALRDLVLAWLFLAVAGLPLFAATLGVRWFSFLQQSAFIALGAAFVIGMALARLHAISAPLQAGDDEHAAAAKGS